MEPFEHCAENLSLSLSLSLAGKGDGGLVEFMGNSMFDTSCVQGCDVTGVT